MCTRTLSNNRKTMTFKKWFTFFRCICSIILWYFWLTSKFLSTIYGPFRESAWLIWLCGWEKSSWNWSMIMGMLTLLKWLRVSNHRSNWNLFFALCIYGPVFLSCCTILILMLNIKRVIGLAYWASCINCESITLGCKSIKMRKRLFTEWI